MVVGSTIAANSAKVSSFTGDGLMGGGLYASDQVTIQDTIVAENTIDPAGQLPNSGVNSGPDVFTYSNSGLSAAFSLIKDTSGATFTSKDAATTANEGRSPQLGALADNGGATKTMKPAVTSPVVDGGSAFKLLTDQRGLTRLFDAPSVANASGGDGSDIGAVELQASDFSATPPPASGGVSAPPAPAPAPGPAPPPEPGSPAGDSPKLTCARVPTLIGHTLRGARKILKRDCPEARLDYVRPCPQGRKARPRQTPNPQTRHARLRRRAGDDLRRLGQRRPRPHHGCAYAPSARAMTIC